MIQGRTRLHSLFQSFENGKVQELHLTKGQLVQGKIVELINGKQAIVFLQGTKVLANLEVPVTKGQHAWFLVTSASKEIRLKLMNKNKDTNQLIQSSRELLSYFGLKNTEINRAILSELIKFDLPIEKGVFHQLSKLIDQETDIPKLIPALKFVMEKELPIHATHIRAVYELFEEGSLLQKISDLKQGIETFLSEIVHRSSLEKDTFSSPVKNEPISKEILLLLQKVHQQSQRFIEHFPLIQQGTKKENLTIQLPPKLQTDEIVHLPKKTSVNGIRNFSQTTQGDGVIYRPSNLQTDETVPRLQKTSTDELVNLSQKMTTQELEIEKLDIHQLFSRLIRYLEQLDLNPYHTDGKKPLTSFIENLKQLYLYKEQLPKDILPMMEKVMHHIAGQRLAMLPEPAMFTQFVIQMPNFFDFAKKPTLVQIHSKKKAGKRFDPEDIRFVFLFQMDYLQEMMVNLHVLQKQLTIQVFNDHWLIKEIIKALEPAFIKAIEEQGYHTSGISVHAMNKNHVSAISAHSYAYKGVDIRI